MNYFCFKKTLNEIKKNNIIVAPADKNVGIVLLESRIYYDLCKEHLYDKTIYKSISFNPHFHLLNKCKTTLKTLCSNGHISNEIYSKLNSNIENKKLPSARILPKLHKQKFGIRPLINCSMSITSPISKFIDF